MLQHPDEEIANLVQNNGGNSVISLETIKLVQIEFLKFLKRI